MVFGTQSVSLDSGPREESEDQETDGERVGGALSAGPWVPSVVPG